MKQFKTESQKLLDLMINSIYTNREIFLRELISNASDAIDKLNFLALTNTEARSYSEAPEIRLAFDKDARTITISDTGIGMDEAAMEENLGTIAHSGSEEFKRENAAAKGETIDIIGQFGVGFYSAFMVAKRVRVVSRAFGSDCAFAWESDGKDGYTIEPAKAGERDGQGEWGTTITLYLRDSAEATEDGELAPGTLDAHDSESFLSEWGLRSLVQRYSNYVRYPITMMVTKSRPKPKPEDAGDDWQPEYETYSELETLNSMTPIWKKRQSEVEDSDYNEFYKSTFHDWQDPARTMSLHAEGALNYDALMFIPSEPPFDLYSKDYERGLALYSSNVLIQEKCQELLPEYLNFVRGVVDSSDVSLNISRETLQQNSQLKAIARRVERKILSELDKMQKDEREAYEHFFKNFGRAIKFGIYNSYGAKAKELSDLLLFWSAKDEREITLKEYAEARVAADDGHANIYFAAGQERARILATPAVKTALAHGVDVLICTQDVDEFMFQTMHNYTLKGRAGDSENAGTEDRDLKLINVATADLDLATDEEKEEAKEVQDKNGELFEALKTALGDAVAEVKVGSGMGDVAASVVSEGGVSLGMERVMSQGPDAEHAPRARRILQLNPQHKVFEKLSAAKAAGNEERLSLLAHVLYDQALLIEGLPLDDPEAFAKNVVELM